MSDALAWLLTYLLHSTALLGGALLVRVLLRERRLALQEAVLRAALVGGFVTASLQVGLAVRPWGGALPIVEGPRAADVAVVASAAASHPGAARPEAAAWTAPNSGAGPAPARPSGPARLRKAVENGWRPFLLGAWPCLAVIGLARLGVAVRRLRRLLAGRRPIVAGALPRRLATLAEGVGLRHPVRLSTTPLLSVPLATGLRRPEVCLPERALTGVDGDGLVALCAHEVAHLARRDPAWILVARLAAALIPLQPLNLWAARRLHDLAECLADDLAVAASARPLGLARSLVDVAAWTVAEPVHPPATAAAALSARSRLRHRVERLMDPVRPLERPRRVLLPLAALVVVATAFVAPVVSGGDPRDGDPPRAVSEVQAPDPAPSASPGSPVAAPARRAPRAAPRAEREEESDAERRMEALTRRIEERARLNRDEMRKLEAEIEALAARVRPREQDLERLRAEAERVAESARLTEEDRRAIEEKARALAEMARPTAEEERELRHLAEEMARVAMPKAEEIARMSREAADAVGPELERAIEELHRAAEELRRAAEEHRRAADEVRRKLKER